MLRGMVRFVVFAAAVAAASAVAAVACGSKSSDKASAAPPPAPSPAPIAEKGGAKTDPGPPPAQADDPTRHLQPDEGTLTIGKGEAAAGSEATIAITVKPAAGFHVSKNYPTKLTLQPPDGVKVAKAELNAGGRDEAKGDADELSEQLLAFSVKATAAKPGSYEIKGTFKFGVCDKDSCHAKKQPIAIQVAAK